MDNKRIAQIIMQVIENLNSKDVYLYGPDFELYVLLELDSMQFDEYIDKVFLELIEVAYNRNSYFFRYRKLNASEIEDIFKKMEKSNILDENEKFVRLLESVHPYYRKEVANLYFKEIRNCESSDMEDISDFPSDLPDLPF